ncbi:MAG: transglycosylase SLT domain-containing protein, partial [Candidatus Thiodiazotropha sp. (ex Cardiolucina cf. quadrata)]|nr:transglycosylase SLT domain-containing protein [Candidatus Thiodiazotropha sp. (ex Cardiolucina cf. quadrata)]
KIESRLDPKQSIIGGARYLRFVEKKLPERVPEPDRLWMTLAGYNVGFGHLEDARILTEHLGDDPDKWVEVKKHLPKLSLKKWYSSLKRGYARGKEPVNYVDNIRAYFELLKWQLRQMELANQSENNPSHALSIIPEAL